jgi:sulfatase modifying factor 1
MRDRARPITVWCLVFSLGCAPVATSDDASTSDAALIDASTTDAYDGTGEGAAQRSCRVSGTPGCGLVAIAGGTLTLGELPSDGGAIDAAPLQPGITVSPFFLDRFEVTKARFTAFWSDHHPDAAVPILYPGMHAITLVGPVLEPILAGNTDCNWALPGRLDHPINCIDWATAQAFCVWDGGRLPTAAEWELAARGVEARTFPWGASPPTDALACGLNTGGTCAVGSRPMGRTPEGLFDMAGNVREWNADWYVPYGEAPCWDGTPRTDPLCGPTTLDMHVIVGGSWINDLDARWMHPATRYWGLGAIASGEGVRCAR